MTDTPTLPRDPRERAKHYVEVYQSAGAAFFALPEPDEAFSQSLAVDGKPEAVGAEWHAYSAAYHALWAAMDALAALVDVLDTGATP